MFFLAGATVLETNGAAGKSRALSLNFIHKQRLKLALSYREKV
jgi:hypothetical protein